MPELPEITSRAAQIQKELVGKTIQAIEVLQPKCLNVPVEEFKSALTGATLLNAHNRGKWIFIETSHGWLLLNLGMGGEILHTSRRALPEKVRLIIDFSDETSLAINFWWFGYAHFVPAGQLASHEITANLGPNALDLSEQEFVSLLNGQRTRVKAFLLDQHKIAGIGNAYIHDILFLAGLHPLRSISSLTQQEVEALHRAINDGLRPALEKGGAFYEVDLHGWKGGFTIDDVLIGYKESQPCPRCGTSIEKIKTGSTSSFICPHCQPF